MPAHVQPPNISWGLEDRTALVRVKGGAEASRHIEYRAPAALSNPYLVGAAILAAGLKGMADGMARRTRPTRLMPAEDHEAHETLP